MTGESSESYFQRHRDEQSRKEQDAQHRRDEEYERSRMLSKKKADALDQDINEALDGYAKVYLKNIPDNRRRVVGPIDVGTRWQWRINVTDASTRPVQVTLYPVGLDSLSFRFELVGVREPKTNLEATKQALLEALLDNLPQ